MTTPSIQELRFNIPQELLNQQAPQQPAIGTPIDQQQLDALNRVGPLRLDYILYPGDGDYGLIAAGTTTIDFVNQIVLGPSGSLLQLSVDQDTLALVQSLFITADSPVAVQVLPGGGLFPVAPGAVVSAPYRKVTAIKIITDVPCLATIALSTGLTAAGVVPVALTQKRYSDVTLTKGVAAGQTEGLADVARAVAFTARTEAKALLQSTGVGYIRTVGVGQKLFIVRNLGPGAVDVQLFGTMLLTTPPVVAAARANTDGWVVDPDQAGTGAPTNIASGSDAVIESGIGWHLVQLRARLASAAAQGTQARLILEYAGLIPALR